MTAASNILMDLAGALRLPFLAASVLPFIAGSVAAGGRFDGLKFSLGLAAVMAAHLGANLLNDYADSKSGADWADLNPYVFFGGSKYIQRGIFSEGFYLTLAAVFFAKALLAVLALAAVMKSWSVVFYAILVLFLAASYSYKPLALSHRRMGEAVIFILFGPALVMGGYFIQTGIFPEFRAFMLSLPFGFLTTAILFANEVPDYTDDSRCGKFTLVAVTGQNKAYILYMAFITAAFVTIFLNVLFGILRPVSLLSFIFMILALRAAITMKDFPRDKMRLIISSKLTVALQGLISLILIAGAVQ